MKAKIEAHCWGDDDDDEVKLVILYFAHNVVIGGGGDTKKVIQDRFIHLVGTLRDYCVECNDGLDMASHTHEI